MIRVRYKELSPGLHGKAERSTRGTTVYLLPGLTVGQRRAALRRLRFEASRGCGPELRAPDLAVALAADRFRVGFRNTAAVVRMHPAGSLLPTALTALLMALFVLVSVSARIGQVPQPTSPGGLLPAGGSSVAGSPAHAQVNRLGPASGSVAPGVGAKAGTGGSAWWSLVSSSWQAGLANQNRHRSAGIPRRARGNPAPGVGSQAAEGEAPAGGAALADGPGWSG